MEEYKIVAKDVDTPNHTEFGYRIPKEVVNKRAKWRDYSLVKEYDQLNEKMKTVGYKIR